MQADPDEEREVKGHEKDHAPAPMAAIQKEIRAARNQPTQRESQAEAGSGKGGLKGRRGGHFSPVWRRLSRPEWGASGKDTQQRPQHIPGIAACQPVPIPVDFVVAVLRNHLRAHEVLGDPGNARPRLRLGKVKSGSLCYVISDGLLCQEISCVSPDLRPRLRLGKVKSGSLTLLCDFGWALVSRDKLCVT
jgi:hypothetical protein